MQDAAKSTFMEKYLTPIAIVVGALLIGGALMFGQGGTSGTATNSDQKAAKAADISKVKVEGEPTIGNANAPVTIAVWYDYQCSFCKQFDQAVVASLYTDYIQAGKVKVVMKDFQFLGEDSQTAALYGRAVYEAYPDHYYAWIQGMFDAQDQSGDQGFGDLASIDAMTKEKAPAIDVARIKQLMDSNKSKYQSAIAASRAEGSAFGINGTPTAIIGKQVITGGPLYDAANVRALIDAELTK